MSAPTPLSDSDRQQQEAERFARLDQMWRAHGAEDEWVFCAHMLRNGDFFIALSLLQEFRHIHGGGRRMRVLVTDEKQAGIAGMFTDRLDSIHIASALTTLPVAETLRWMETRKRDRFEPGGMLMLQPWLGARPPFHLNAFIGESHAFYSAMLAMTLRLRHATALHPAPIGEEAYREGEALARQLGIAPGRTLLLFPYAQSFQAEWGEALALLATRAQAAGWRVMTSCVPGREAPVAGTAAVEIPFPLLRPVCEVAGHAVSARSGISDMLARAACRHVVLFDRPHLIRTWGLRALGWGGTAAELALEPGRQEPAEAAERIWQALTAREEGAQPCIPPLDVDAFLQLSPIAAPPAGEERVVRLGLDAPHIRYRGLAAHPGIAFGEGWWLDHRCHRTYGHRAAFTLRGDAALAEAARQGRARLLLRGEAALSATMPVLDLEIRLGRVAHRRSLRLGEPALLDLPLPSGARLDAPLPCEILVPAPRSPQQLHGRGEDRRPLGFALAEMAVRVEG